ncbi:killer cell immunoglobulin-like receptor 3DL3 [Paramisgurnus dabryanus]|uniref:killer cell immunoglobulin-like receptor 3DL3 n=1 Tax=Paramisgurnus dabryanus TaxID=90735 RepID=UPI003CCF126E
MNIKITEDEKTIIYGHNPRQKFCKIHGKVFIQSGRSIDEGTQNRADVEAMVQIEKGTRKNGEEKGKHSLLISNIHSQQTVDKPTLTVQPQTSVFIGDTVTLICEVYPSTGWDFFFTTPSNIEYLETTGTGVTSVQVAAGGEYKCRARRTEYHYIITHFSKPVTVTVQNKPILTVQPQTSVFIGDSVTLTCEIHQSIGWKFLFRRSPHHDSIETTETKTIIFSVSDGGQYMCAARRREIPQDYTQFSNPITVTVQKSPTPQMSVDPDNHLFRGETVTLRCVINGGGVSSWQYSWYKDSIIQQNKLQYYTIISVIESDAGKYTCRGTEIRGSRYSDISKTVTLTVSGSKPKPKLTSDTEGSVLTGNTVTLKCHIDHWSTGWKFYWYNNTQITEKTTTETNSYTINSVKVSDGGQYWCRAGRGKPDYYTDYSDELWINVTATGSSYHGPIVGLGLGLSVMFVIFFLALLWCYKNKKLSQSPSAVSQHQTSDQKQTEVGYSHLDTGEAHLYDSINTTDNKDTSTDNVSESAELTYADIELKPKKEMKKKEKKGNTSEGGDIVYSKLKKAGGEDVASGSIDVTYAQIK